MIHYYIELIDKPTYILTEAERMYVEVFPFLLVGAVAFIVYLAVKVAVFISEKHRRNSERRNKNDT